MNRGDSILLTEPRKLELSCQVAGPEDAPPVLVLHGITASERYWLPRILPLARTRRLVLPGLPGFGSSPKPIVDYDMDFFTETLFGVMDRHGLGLDGNPVPVIGHSLGALLALELAARQPERIERVALLCAPRFEDPESAHRQMVAGSPSYRTLLMINSPSATLANIRQVGWRLAARSMRRLPLSVLLDARRFTYRSLTSTLENCCLYYSIDQGPPGRRPAPP
jgi:pimeloyl-ACP methyl ester carboxylesterase